MTQATPARRGPDDRRRELLAAAVADADENGLRGVTAATVAQRAGRSKALVFHYFGSAHGLHGAVARVAIEELDAALRAPESVPPAERPTRIAHAYLDAVAEHEAIWRDLWGGALVDVDTDEMLTAVRESLVGRMSLSATSIGFTPTPRLAALARGWVALAENLTATWLTHDGGTAAGRLTRDDVESLLVASMSVLLPELPDPPRSTLAGITGAVGRAEDGSAG
ncbi:DNA-binding transcriptional regulator, AcrR family [Paraoerskovia marina]|uniref:DNA-binding transcriptional regulator, AcrR family n=1 Tax=Paraoerskovia marina TaxID=545619 RepID=A0A1H1PU26_9CELL|nr:TetR/AcrR family transcriptional regulator [Paraoerskovia marina]SDS14626.1 DNA-binding transcriptional regulator, AcrR family [Paraoerskovia marina]